MGHRRSHSRVTNKKGTSEMLSADPKHDGKLNEGGSEAYSKSRREKREHKRKREHKEDASRKRHKERLKGKDHHRHSSKSSAKQKTKERVGRWKNHRSSDSVSSESSGSTSFTSTERISHHHRSRSRSDDKPGEYSKKIYRADDETLGKGYSRGNYEGLHKLPKADKGEVQRQESTTKSRHESSMQRKDTSVGAIGSEVKGQHSESTRKDGNNATISRTMEQEKGLGEKKEKGLEVELRQQALANFMRHQDTSCIMDEHKESSNSASCFRDASNEQAVTDMVIARQNRRAVAEVDGDWTARLSALSDAVSVDAVNATIVEHRWPLASDALSPIQYKSPIEGSTPACHSNTSMEEGEISSDTVQPFKENDTGHENSNPLVEEDEVVYERENIEKGDLRASIDASKKGHKLMSSSSLPEGAMATDTQAELAGVIQHSESIDVQPELPSKSVQEFRSINDTMEHHELQTAAPVSREKIAAEMDKACAQKARTATTSINEKSELSPKHEGKNSECVSKPELATGRQDSSTSFQQKTMSVMRGGELVQVNYKVYIPKRAAELARRRLQR